MAILEAESLIMTVEEAGKLLGLSRGSAYQAVRTGELPSLRIGTRWLVPRAAIARMVAEAGQVPAGE